ncbi:protein of unknown function [Pseudomonas sp. NFPP07]|nr:protein of unknown function [Pseudomonas sp. NFPP07]
MLLNACLAVRLSSATISMACILPRSVRSAPGYRSECFRLSIWSFVKCLDRTKVQQQAQITEVPELKAFAEETLPKLQNHLQMAKALKAGRPLDQLDG